MTLHDMLKTLATQDGSDLYLTVGAQPSAKFQGALKALDDKVLASDTLHEMLKSVLSPELIHQFQEDLELNCALDLENIGRFRLNVFQQRNHLALVARHIKTDIPNFDALKLPAVLKDVILEKRGLILFVGGTGSGKSTSLAALIDYRNTHSAGHIITIEDPIEFIHPHKQSIINQREVGIDTQSYAAALKNTLRQAPDVILIGEIRDQQTMEHALAFAETGHLAISTLHANNANQALDRIINFFPEERHAQLLGDLGNNLRAFVSQRLIPSSDGKRRAAVEIMLGSHTVRENIRQNKLSTLKEIMEKSRNIGMQTFDQALFDLVQEGIISEEDALSNADSANNLRLKIKLGQDSATEDESKDKGWDLEPN